MLHSGAYWASIIEKDSNIPSDFIFQESYWIWLHSLQSFKKPDYVKKNMLKSQQTKNISVINMLKKISLRNNV